MLHSVWLSDNLNTLSDTSDKRYLTNRRINAVISRSRRSIATVVLGGILVAVLGVVGLKAIEGYKNIKQLGEEESKRTKKDSSKTKKTSTTKSSSSSSNKPRSKASSGFGIDIGTSFGRISLMSLCKDNSSFTVDLIENREGLRHTPFVLRKADGAGNLIVGTCAKTHKYNGSTLYGIQQYLGLSVPSTSTLPFNLTLDPATSRLAACGISLDDALMVLLKDLKLTAEQKQANFDIPTILAIPTNFSSTQSTVVSEICNNAGLQVVPVTDSLCAVQGSFYSKLFKFDSNTGNKLVLVVDVGGFCTQLSVLTVSLLPDGQIVSGSVNHHLSLPTVGGEIFDSKLASHISAAFKKKTNIDLLVDIMAAQRIRDAAETSKIELTRQVSVDVNLPYITADQKGPRHLLETYSRSKFEGIIEGELKLLKDSITKIKDDHKGISDVILVGGGARIPIIKETVKDAVGMEVICDAAPEDVVAIGAGCLSRM